MIGPQLRSGQLRLTLAPRYGGAVAGFWLDRSDGAFAIMRPLPEGAEDALHAAMFPMLPFANCIRNNCFSFAGQTWTVEPNMTGERLNFHGSGWRLPWTVHSAGPDRARLELRADDGVWVYEAAQDVVLTDDGLSVYVSVTNISAADMPFSFGVHPWFLRHDEALVEFAAKGIWTLSADREKLVRVLPIAGRNYAAESPPPREYVNDCYDGWAGHARIRWPSKSIVMDLRADPVFGRLMFHVPAHDPGTFCLEPQTNAPYGFDGLETGVPAPGIHILRPGDKLSGRITMNISDELLGVQT